MTGRFSAFNMAASANLAAASALTLSFHAYSRLACSSALSLAISAAVFARSSRSRSSVSRFSNSIRRSASHRSSAAFLCASQCAFHLNPYRLWLEAGAGRETTAGHLPLDSSTPFEGAAERIHRPEASLRPPQLRLLTPSTTSPRHSAPSAVHPGAPLGEILRPNRPLQPLSTDPTPLKTRQRGNNSSNSPRHHATQPAGAYKQAFNCRACRFNSTGINSKCRISVRIRFGDSSWGRCNSFNACIKFHAQPANV